MGVLYSLIRLKQTRYTILYSQGICHTMAVDFLYHYTTNANCLNGNCVRLNKHNSQQKYNTRSPGLELAPDQAAQ